MAAEFADRLEKAIARALGAAEAELRAVGAVAPAMRFEGPLGEAAVRLGSESGAAREKTAALRAALKADLVVMVFESRIELAAGGGARVVVAIARGPEDARMRVTGVSRTREGRLVLRTFAAAIAGAGGADGPVPLLAMSDIADVDPAEAWRRLETLGVDVDAHGRALH